MMIRELMDGLRKLDMVLPEFQREYVWEREQAKQLMVSLFRSYPTGSLLFWKTDNLSGNKECGNYTRQNWNDNGDPGRATEIDHLVPDDPRRDSPLLH
jgi:hypothetical protein